MKRTKKSQKLSNVQKIILGVIIAASVVVAIATCFGLLYRPESVIKGKITNLATDYYENYIYANISEVNGADKTPKILEKYHEYGFTIVTLRQILLHDQEKNAKEIEYFDEHCDMNNTLVKFYPEEPYDRTAYRVEYTYSCDF